MFYEHDVAKHAFFNGTFSFSFSTVYPQLILFFRLSGKAAKDPKNFFRNTQMEQRLVVNASTTVHVVMKLIGNVQGTEIPNALDVEKEHSRHIKVESVVSVENAAKDFMSQSDVRHSQILNAENVEDTVV